MGKLSSVIIEEELTGGDPRRLGKADEVTALVMAEPDRVGELLECVFAADEIVRMRASDALEKVCRQRPELLQPFIERLLTEMAEIAQPSVQWHLAQILGEVELGPDERARAVTILRRNLEEYDDWIVVNLSLESLAGFARADPSLRPDLVKRLRAHSATSYKSVASRVKKLLAEFG